MYTSAHTQHTHTYITQHATYTTGTPSRLCIGSMFGSVSYGHTHKHTHAHTHEGWFEIGSRLLLTHMPKTPGDQATCLHTHAHTHIPHPDTHTHHIPTHTHQCTHTPHPNTHLQTPHPNTHTPPHHLTPPPSPVCE